MLGPLVMGAIGAGVGYAAGGQRGALVGGGLGVGLGLLTGARAADDDDDEGYGDSTGLGYGGMSYPTTQAPASVTTTASPVAIAQPVARLPRLTTGGPLGASPTSVSKTLAKERVFVGTGVIGAGLSAAR